MGLISRVSSRTYRKTKNDQRPKQQQLKKFMSFFGFDADIPGGDDDFVKVQKKSDKRKKNKVKNHNNHYQESSYDKLNADTFGDDDTTWQMGDDKPLFEKNNNTNNGGLQEFQDPAIMGFQDPAIQGFNKLTIDNNGLEAFQDPAIQGSGNFFQDPAIVQDPVIQAFEESTFQGS